MGLLAKLPVRWRLPLIVLTALALRLWRLAAKPLWIDELYTAFYGLGKDPTVLPMDVVQHPSQYWQLLLPGGTPLAAARAVTTYSNHPPGFFMALNPWLHWLGTSVWSLRAFAVLWGTGAVVAMFYLGQRVGGARLGHIAALTMAVSPYGIYLSQEARHYSLAIAIATCALVQWLALLQGKRSWSRWLAWVGLNTLGLYVHYFYSLGLMAQALVALYQRRRRPWPWLGALAAVALLYLPWLPTALGHFQSDGGTGWLRASSDLLGSLILPWVQSAVALVFMVVLLPVEQMPVWVVVPAALAMLATAGWLLRQLIRGWCLAPLPGGAWPVIAYGLGVCGLMLAITYGLGKDLTLAPRYFFMVYPAITLAIALGLSRCRTQVLAVAIAAGLVSQLLISYDLALLKPYLPGQIGQRLASQAPALVLAAIQKPEQAPLALSYTLAIPATEDIWLGFTAPGPPGPWRPSLGGSEPLTTGPPTLWLVELRRRQPFPAPVDLPQHRCMPQGETLNTEGIRQQRYRCEATAK